MPGPLRLGILDQSPIPEGSTAMTALQDTIALSQLADRLGYSRYWLAEHHDHPGLAGPAPEVTVAAVAAATERIRVGSGGVMLPRYSPLKVAEQFKVLEALHPGRIDLGLGRAPGSDPTTALALNQQQNPDDFPNQVQDVIGRLEDRLDPRHPGRAPLRRGFACGALRCGAGLRPCGTNHRRHPTVVGAPPRRAACGPAVGPAAGLSPVRTSHRRPQAAPQGR